MDSQQKLRGMLEGALLGAVWVLLLYLTMYTPLFFVTAILLPIPLTILTYRQGMQIAGMTAVLFVLLAAIFNLLFVGFNFVLYSVVMGIVSGYCLYYRKPTTVILLGGALATLATLLGTLVILRVLTGYDMMSDFAVSFQQSLDQSASMLESMGMASQLEGIEAINIDQMVSMMRMMMPTVFIIISAMNAYVYYWIVIHVFKRLGEKIPQLPSLTVLRLPKSILGYYVVAIFAMLFMNSFDSTGGFWYLLVFSIVQILTLALAVQGISVLWFYMKKQKWPSIARVPILFLLLHPLVFQITAWIGMLDMFFNWRRLLK